jgi:hypothetical protein
VNSSPKDVLLAKIDSLLSNATDAAYRTDLLQWTVAKQCPGVAWDFRGTRFHLARAVDDLKVVRDRVRALPPADFHIIFEDGDPLPPCEYKYEPTAAPLPGDFEDKLPPAPVDAPASPAPSASDAVFTSLDYLSQEVENCKGDVTDQGRNPLYVCLGRKQYVIITGQAEDWGKDVVEQYWRPRLLFQGLEVRWDASESYVEVR